MHTQNTRNVGQSANTPGGKPDILFNVPSTANAEFQGIEVTNEDITVAKDVIGIDCSPLWKNRDLHELLQCYIRIHNLRIPLAADDALDLFVKLLEHLENDGFEV